MRPNETSHVIHWKSTWGSFVIKGNSLISDQYHGYINVNIVNKWWFHFVLEDYNRKSGQCTTISQRITRYVHPVGAISSVTIHVVVTADLKKNLFWTIGRGPLKDARTAATLKTRSGEEKLLTSSRCYSSASSESDRHNPRKHDLFIFLILKVCFYLCWVDKS